MMQRISLAIFVCLWMVFTIGIIVKVSDTKNTAVVLENTDARFEPIADSTTHYRLSWGEKVKILSAEDQWMKVKRSDGKSGWIPRENAKW
ncbi:MAG: SH3 domain-containing protein, partial [Candidatus Omnitrophica bacterium]|nr:SH3 domain-containing protein [Candidatus Omnitrophota bacterium]